MKAVTCHLHQTQDAERLVGALHAARFCSYDIAPETGGLCISVHTTTPLEELRAARIMQEFGAEEIETALEPNVRRWGVLRELPRL